MFLCSGCEYFLGPTCGAAGCRLDITPSGRVHEFGQTVEFVVELSSAVPFSARLFQDRLCNVKLRVAHDSEHDVFGFRVCVAWQSSIPEKGYRDSGARGEFRSTFVLEDTERQRIGPENKVTYTVSAVPELIGPDTISLRFADDVYVAFQDHNLLMFNLAYSRHEYFGDEDGHFRGYLKVGTVMVDGERRLSLEPTRIEYGSE